MCHILLKSYSYPHFVMCPCLPDTPQILATPFRGSFSHLITFTVIAILLAQQTHGMVLLCTVNYGTWESLVAGLAHANELRTLRKEARASGKLPPPAKPPGPRLTVSNKATYNRALSAYALPFPGRVSSPAFQTPWRRERS